MKRFFYRILFFLAAVALLLDGWALVDFALHPLARDGTFSSPLYRAATALVLLPLTLLVGFLIMRRVPGNAVGPLLIVWSGTVAYNSVRIGLVPVAFGLFYGYNLIFGWMAFFLLILHFPDASVKPTGAARWIYRILCLNLPLNTLVFLAQPVFDIPSRVANPFFLPVLTGLLSRLEGLALLFFTPVLVLNLVSPVLRYRGGSLLQRQQIKWLALLGGVTVLYSLLGLILYPTLTGRPVMNPGTGLFGALFYFFTGLFPPLAIGVAVLRYRLWDIDHLIRRTLVYSILTLLLTLIYFGSVVVLQNLFALVFQLSSSDLAIVLSTLAIVVLFTPLRRRIQSAIDRRFFRQRYNADQILAGFAATARGEVSLEPLAAALLQNVEETLQPEQMNLWLKK